MSILGEMAESLLKAAASKRSLAQELRDDADRLLYRANKMEIEAKELDEAHAELSANCAVLCP